MDNSTRLQYLEAMGIDVWVPREIEPDEEILPDEEKQFLQTGQTENLHEPGATDWSDLEKQVTHCQQCELCNTRTQTVFGSGNQQADWMLVGEAPGKSEDLKGEPFVGPAGILLTEMIRAIGLQREAVYITNIVKCRPPDDRAPKGEEVTSCNGYLRRQIELIKPKVILAVGRVAAQTLLETKEPLSKLRGVVHQLNGIPLVVVYHPAYLLRALLEKRKAWQDLQLALRQIRK